MTITTTCHNMAEKENANVKLIKVKIKTNQYDF